MSKPVALVAAVLLGLAACLLVFAALAGQSAVLASDLRDAPENLASWNRQLISPAPEPTLIVPEFFVVRVNYASRSELDQLASWLEPWEVHPEEQYLVVGVTLAELERLRGSGLSAQILPDQTGALFALPADPAQTSGIPGYACYRTVDETLATAAGLAQNFPGLVEWVDIGDSWEKQDGQVGDDLVVLRITNRSATHPKPSLFILSSIHARELTPAELNTRFAELLVTSYGVDPDITWLLDYTEIHLLLQANPDGRRYAELATYPYNYWRKNTNNNYCSDTTSRGADLNRNFSFAWNCCGGSSANVCDGTYHGPSAASEPETQAIEQYVRTIFPDQRGPDLEDAAPVDAQGIFLDLHSYSRLVLWPWGYTEEDAPNGTALQTLGRKFAFFNQYTPVQAYDLYVTDGSTDDFAYGELGLAAFTFELGSTFFESCTTFENVILPDNMPALLYAAKAARAPYQIPSGPDVTNLALSSAAVVQGDVVTLTAVLDDSRYKNYGITAEPVQAIAGGELYIDLPPWAAGSGAPVNLPAQDGLFNSLQEAVVYPLDTSQLTPGRHLLFVRGLDAAGNWGAFNAVFLDVQGVQAGFISSSPDLIGATTVFTDTAIGENLSYLWEFGDGSSRSGGGVVTHTYLTSGSFPVTLTVSNTLGTNQAFGMVYIQDIWMYMFPVLQDALPAP